MEKFSVKCMKKTLQNTFYFFPKTKAKSGGSVLDFIAPFELVKDETVGVIKKNSHRFCL